MTVNLDAMRGLRVLEKDFRITAEKLPPVLYGLEGIMRIFNVSRSTAMRYKNGFLKPAVVQKGKVIIIDTVKALESFGVLETGNFVDKPEAAE